MSLHQRDMLAISELASAAADGRLSERDAGRLEEALKASAEAREYYVRFMGISAELTWASHEASPAQAKAAPRPRWWIAAAAAAALILIALGAGLALLRPQQESRNGSAVLVDAYGAEWADGRGPRKLMEPGKLNLKSGLVRIQFSKGTNVWLEGPVEFEVRSPTEGYCRSGKVLVNVPAEGHGFRIGSPAVTVTDRGTGFGLDVHDSQTAVHVFKGEVDINVGGKISALSEDHALLIDLAGILKDIRADLRIFDRPGFINHDMTGPEWAPEWFSRPGRHEGHELRGGPLQFIRMQLEVSPERWFEIGEKLMDVTRLQWELEIGPMAAKQLLWQAAFNPQTSEEEVAKALKAYREARDAVRVNLEAAETDLRTGLTLREQAVLVTYGYLH